MYAKVGQLNTPLKYVNHRNLDHREHQAGTLDHKHSIKPCRKPTISMSTKTKSVVETPDCLWRSGNEYFDLTSPKGGKSFEYNCLSLF